MGNLTPSPSNQTQLNEILKLIPLNRHKLFEKYKRKGVLYIDEQGWNLLMLYVKCTNNFSIDTVKLLL